MPYQIRKIRNKPLYTVKNTETGVFHSKGTTLTNAKKQVALLRGLENKTIKPRGGSIESNKYTTQQLRDMGWVRLLMLKQSTTDEDLKKKIDDVIDGFKLTTQSPGQKGTVREMPMADIKYPYHLAPAPTLASIGEIINYTVPKPLRTFDVLEQAVTVPKTIKGIEQLDIVERLNTIKRKGEKDKEQPSKRPRGKGASASITSRVNDFLDLLEEARYTNDLIRALNNLDNQYDYFDVVKSFEDYIIAYYQNIGEPLLLPRGMRPRTVLNSTARNLDFESFRTMMVDWFGEAFSSEMEMAIPQAEITTPNPIVDDTPPIVDVSTTTDTPRLEATQINPTGSGLKKRRVFLRKGKRIIGRGTENKFPTEKIRDPTSQKAQQEYALQSQLLEIKANFDNLLSLNNPIAVYENLDRDNLNTIIENCLEYQQYPYLNTPLLQEVIEKGNRLRRMIQAEDLLKQQAKIDRENRLFPKVPETDGKGIIETIVNAPKKILSVLEKVPIIGADASYYKTLLYGRETAPPKVRKLLEKYGNAKIEKIVIDRTPLSKPLLYVLNAVSLGDFNKRLDELNIDKLFHLRIDITTNKGVIALEKNEVLNMYENPKREKGSETREIIVRDDITVGEALKKTKELMGDKFLPYSVTNNCSVFILSFLKANKLGSEMDYKFVKQDAKSVFSNNIGLRKFANTITDIGAKMNEAIFGKGVMG
jgi:hypothetical protein